MIDEIECLGVQQLLQSRGAEIIDSGENRSDEKSDKISTSADLLIISNTFDNRPDFSLNKVLDTVSKNASNVPILVICGSFDESRTQHKLETIPNPSGWLVRGSHIEPAALLSAVRKLITGDSPNEIEPFSEWNALAWISTAAHSMTRLTNREHEVLVEVASGLSNKQIASRIGLTVGTVNNHLRAIFRKLDLDDKENINVRVSAALAYCAYNGIMTVSPRTLAQMVDLETRSAA
ncbi:MAG: response regulator transcription factor [Chloroflexi bacterium]|nr:response regulator transcription factor [Chloroflexota bacterium]